jgi:tetratricopeptide (TPR) repeat protein
MKLAYAFSLALVAAGSSALAAPPQENTIPAADAAQEKLLAEAIELVTAGKPEAALAPLDRVIAHYQQAQAGKLVYCARALPEVLAYMTMAAADKKAAIALGPTWANALYVKGFALIELNRRDEARTYLEQAGKLSPYNAHYLGELAEFHKSARDWNQALALFEQAAGAARAWSPDEVKTSELGRALRGSGFVLIELGRLDEAEAKLRQCLELDPNDAGAKSELNYIRDLRASAKPTTS